MTCYLSKVKFQTVNYQGYTVKMVLAALVTCFGISEVLITLAEIEAERGNDGG